MTFSNPSNNACIYAKTFSMFSVVDYLGNDACPTCYLKVERIELWHIVGWKVCSIPPTFDGDVLFEFPLDNLDGHFGQMQGMDKKYDGHVWCKVKWQIFKTISTLLSRWHDAWDMFSSYVVKCQKSFILLQSLVFKFQNSKCIECLCVERMSFHVVFISDTLKVVMGKLNFCVHP